MKKEKVLFDLDGVKYFFDGRWTYKSTGRLDKKGNPFMVRIPEADYKEALKKKNIK